MTPSSLRPFAQPPLHLALRFSLSFPSPASSFPFPFFPLLYLVLQSYLFPFLQSHLPFISSLPFLRPSVQPLIPFTLSLPFLSFPFTPSSPSFSLVPFSSDSPSLYYIHPFRFTFSLPSLPCLHSHLIPPNFPSLHFVPSRPFPSVSLT